MDVKHHVYLWMAVAFCLTGWNSTLSGLWWICHQGTLWILAVCCFSQWEASFSDSVLPAGHSRQCFGQSWPCRCRSGSFEVQWFHILLVWTMLFGFTTDLNQNWQSLDAWRLRDLPMHFAVCWSKRAGTHSKQATVPSVYWNKSYCLNQGYSTLCHGVSNDVRFDVLRLTNVRDMEEWLLTGPDQPVQNEWVLLLNVHGGE